MFFSTFSTVGKTKSEYRRLAFLHHPDHGGDVERMKQINIEYHRKLESLHGQTSTGSDKKQHTYYYSATTEQAIMDKIAELLSLKMADVTIELIGTWLWIHGNTRTYKEQLKACGCLWHGKRKRWYWRKATRRRKMSRLSFDQMRFAYGSRVFDDDDRQPAPAAIQA